MTDARTTALHVASRLVEEAAAVPYWIGRAAWATSQALWRVDEGADTLRTRMWRASVWLEEQAEARRPVPRPSHLYAFHEEVTGPEVDCPEGLRVFWEGQEVGGPVDPKIAQRIIDDARAAGRHLRWERP